MSTLWFVRHGPTHAKGMNGWTDVPADLSDSAALARLAAALPSDLPMVSSDLIRARDTASAIAAERPRLPDDPDLREVHFGEWEARDFGQVWLSAPRLAQKLWDEPGDVHPPGGESWNALSARVSTAIDRLAAQNPDGLILVVHFGVILSQVQRATGETAKQVFGHKLRHLSITKITKDPNQRLALFDHIP